MGTFTAKLRVWNPARSSEVEELELMIDTGAPYSWLSRERIERLGVRPVWRMQFRTKDGQVIERELAPVFVAIDGFTGAENVVIAEPGDMEVLGWHTLNALGLKVNEATNRLVRITEALALSAA